MISTQHHDLANCRLCTCIIVIGQRLSLEMYFICRVLNISEIAVGRKISNGLILILAFRI